MQKYVTLQIEEIQVQAGFITKVAPTKALHLTIQTWKLI